MRLAGKIKKCKPQMKHDWGPNSSAGSAWLAVHSVAGSVLSGDIFR